MYVRLSLFLPGRKVLRIDGAETKEPYFPMETTNGVFKCYWQESDDVSDVIITQKSNQKR